MILSDMDKIVQGISNSNINFKRNSSCTSNNQKRNTSTVNTFQPILDNEVEKLNYAQNKMDMNLRFIK